jgi:putative ABC transport system permease protein
VDAAVQGDYELLRGTDALAPDAMVVNEVFLRATGARLGDTLLVATGYDPQLRTFTGRRRLVVRGEARFIYLAADQAAAAMPLPTLQAMGGRDRADHVSLYMASVQPGAEPSAVRDRISREVPRVTAITTSDALVLVEQRLSYFRQLAFILGTVSLLVGFLLVTTLETVSVNERIGEFAVQRALGVSRWHVVRQVALEGIAISLTGAVIGTGLGLVTARYLNAILSDFPGLPAAIDFFLFQPRAALIALGLLALSGIAAGLYPAWRAASLPIAHTLRQEAVA